MTSEEIKKFLEYYKTTDEYKSIPEEEKPIHLAAVIKELINTEIKGKKQL